ncbi:hypothetical protein [Nocardia amamiensis]|uniref:hypothetical protein n=1 Tax=Nocardia amamiensis TaxID=404578 RepID=UPI0033D826C3
MTGYEHEAGSAPRRFSFSLRGKGMRTCAAVAAVLAIICALWIVQEPDGQPYKIVVLLNIDANTAGNGLDLIEATTASRAAEMAGPDGELVIAAASGGAAVQLTSIELGVERDGQRETDNEVVRRVIEQRVRPAFDSAAAKLKELSAEGRDLTSLLRQAGSYKPAPEAEYIVYYVGLGLGTVDPSDARIQLRGDPGQAVAALRQRLPNIQDAELHVLFPAATRPQPDLNPATAQWRAAFWAHLAEAMDARLASIQETNLPAPALPTAPAAPVLANLDDPTALLALPDSLAMPHGASAPVLLAGTNFQPDSPQFVNDELARDHLATLRDAWQSHLDAYSHAVCTGRTLALGPRDGAIGLSRQRAEQAAKVLRSFGIPVTAVGVGYDDPIPDISPFDPRQRSVVCHLLPREEK